jgi:hypothetical protein
MDDFGAPDKVELSKGRDAFAIQRRLEAEVEAFQGFDGQQLGCAQRYVNSPCLTRAVFFRQKAVDSLNGSDLTLLKSLYCMIKSFERAGHLQPDHCASDPV